MKSSANANVKIACARELRENCVKGKLYGFGSDVLCTAMYRLFAKESCYFDRRFNEKAYQLSQLFHMLHYKSLICVSEKALKPFSALLGR